MGGSSYETERVRALYDKMSPTYDTSIGFWEKVLFGDGRAWVCRQARGDVLDLAVGTGRTCDLSLLHMAPPAVV